MAEISEMLLCIFKGLFFIKILQHGDLFPHTECGNKSPFSVKTDVTETQTAWVTVLKTYTRVPESLCRVLCSASAGEWGSPVDVAEDRGVKLSTGTPALCTPVTSG